MKAAGSTARRSIRVLSPRIEPPVRLDDGSTASTATRCPSPVSIVPNASMNVDLPDARHPADADPPRPAAVREQLGQQLLRQRPVLGPGGLDEGDGARDDRPLPVEHALDVRVEYRSQVVPEVGREPLDEVVRRVRDHRPGREHGRRAHLQQRRHVLRRDHPADHDHDVLAALRGQLLAQRRYEGEVPGGQRGHARRCGRPPPPPAGPPRPASGTAGRRRRRSRGRRRRWRSPSGRGRGRPGPSWRPGCAGGGPRPPRRRPPACGCGPRTGTRLLRCGTPRRSYGSGPRAARTPSPARPRSPRRWPSRGPRPPPAPAGCPQPPGRPGQRVAARPGRPARRAPRAAAAASRSAGCARRSCRP